MNMNKKRELTCIGCPIGCTLSVTLKDGKVVDVKGNTCIKGKTYAEKECTNPTRIITSSIKVKKGEIDRISVKTEKDIPKNKILDCIEAMKGVEVEAPINEGDIIIENVAGTNVNIISTKNVKNIEEIEHIIYNKS